MSDASKPSQSPMIPTSQKIVFGIGMLGNQMFPAALGVFMVVLVQGLGMDPLLWGILFFVPRLFDAITDPIMGFVTDNTQSRWGRRRPYIFIGAVIAGLAYIAMWQIYPENGQAYNFWYFLLLSLVFYLGMTIFSTPYVAMGYELSNNFHERTRLMAVAQWIGQWAWVIVPWFWIIIYDPNMFPDPASAARTLSIWVGLFCLGLCLVPAIFGRAPPPPENTESLSLSNIGSNFKSLLSGLTSSLKNRAFMQLCLATFFVFNSFNTIAAFSFFIIVHYMNGGDPGAAGTWPAWFGTLSALSTCFLVIPIITLLSRRIGKKNTFMVSQGISLLGYAMFWFAFVPEQPLLMFLPLPFFAFGIGGLFTLMMSMTADVCDIDELESGQRREGTFAAVYWWMVKFGLAFAGIISGLVLKVVGFDQNASSQSQAALDGLINAYIIVPSVGTILAMLIMMRYSLDEKQADAARAALEERRGTRQLA